MDDARLSQAPLLGVTTMSDQGCGLALSAAPPLRRGSTPLPIKHQLRREEAVSEDYDWAPGLDEPDPPPVSVSGAQEETPCQSPQGSYNGPLRIVLLGQNGVGKSLLAMSLAGLSDRSLSLDSESSAGEGYQRRVTVDDEDGTILVYDNWKQDISTLQCEVVILVFSLTDRRSFHRTAQLRLLLRETQPRTPIILVGNKSDLVRSREISAEEAHSSALMYDCPYLELSASLDHRTSELLDGAVRVARGYSVGPGWPDGAPGGGRRESLTTKAKRFLSGLVPRSYGRDRERERDRERGGRDLSRHRASRMMRQKSRSCHDLSAL
ncbi:GTP-binding protein REM 2 [Denticeps clupeoides]|uniref:Small monomeric GTPase n=1 Tax=Denticeps clupeoides TaxID=299321 RepID=A0AAY4AP86_9TELE|nr:GTP-binding protein REM 2-like [Denticeps clupeoides]